jgi:hypothetical protein
VVNFELTEGVGSPNNYSAVDFFLLFCFKEQQVRTFVTNEILDSVNAAQVTTEAQVHRRNQKAPFTRMQVVMVLTNSVKFIKIQQFWLGPNFEIRPIFIEFV